MVNGSRPDFNQIQRSDEKTSDTAYNQSSAGPERLRLDDYTSNGTADQMVDFIASQRDAGRRHGLVDATNHSEPLERNFASRRKREREREREE